MDEVEGCSMDPRWGEEVKCILAFVGLMHLPCCCIPSPCPILVELLGLVLDDTASQLLFFLISCARCLTS